ncbi:unnamed protein product, partial [Closterium sp. NIES-53]
VKRPPGSLPVFKARYVARGFSQRQGVDYFQTFSLTPKMSTLRGSLHEEIWLRRPPGFTGSFPPGTQWSLRRPVYGLRQAPREWHDTLRTTLAALEFAPSTADPPLFLRTDTLLPPFYILVYVDDLVFAMADTAGLAHMKARCTITLTQSHMVQQVLQRFDFTYSSPQATPLSTRHSLSALPSDESVEPSGPYPKLVGCLMYLMTCTRPDLAYPLSILARYVAPGRHRPEHMAAAKRVLRYLCSTSGLGLVLGGRSPVVLTGHADASWVDDLATQRSSQGYNFSLGSGSISWRSTRSSSELRWLTYLLNDLGEPPRSPPVLYVDNNAMLALCREHRLEHRTKHIALRYFLARELQQRGQLRLAYVASQANTADIFTKALQPCDHQRFCTMLACFAFLCFACLVLDTRDSSQWQTRPAPVPPPQPVVPPVPPTPPTPSTPPAPPAPPIPPAPPVPPAVVVPRQGVLQLLLPPGYSAFDAFLSEPERSGGEGSSSAPEPRWGAPADCPLDESATGADDDVEFWAADGLPKHLQIPSFPPPNKKRPHPSRDNRDARPLSPRHKPTKHRRNSYTSHEKLQWIPKLEVGKMSVRRMSRESGISRRCLTEWKSRKGELECAHGARCSLHGRGRSSWYRDMEAEVYRRFLPHRKK